MYRRDLQRKMEEEQFLNRISSLPMVNSAVCQVTDIYFKTKEHNSLFRFTLGTAESGVKSVASHAQPIVTKFDGPGIHTKFSVSKNNFIIFCMILL